MTGVKRPEKKVASDEPVWGGVQEDDGRVVVQVYTKAERFCY